jgi:hypothetical protein
MDLKVNLARENEIIDGRKLANYIVIEVIEYICKITNEDLQKQDITLLIQNETADVKKMIIDIAKNVKRIQIVSPKINQFNNLENELEDKYGVACLITNNKRKSLLRSRIIVNIDYSEDMINQFVINKNAIIMDINNNLNIYAKSFSGIHIYNYNIRSNIANNSFDVKKIIQARLEGKTYEQIRDFLHNNEVRIINLVGKNGIINTNEFKNLVKKA